MERVIYYGEGGESRAGLIPVIRTCSAWRDDTAWNGIDPGKVSH